MKKMRKDYFAYIMLGFKDQNTGKEKYLTCINPQVKGGLTLEQAEEQLKKDLKELDGSIKEGLKRRQLYLVEMLEFSYYDNGLVKECKTLYEKQLN